MSRNVKLYLNERSDRSHQKEYLNRRDIKGKRAGEIKGHSQKVAQEIRLSPRQAEKGH